MVKVEATIDKSKISSITKSFLGLQDNIEIGLQKAMLYAESSAKESFGQTGNLQSRSGRYRASIQSGTDKLKGWLQSKLKYAAIHEYGGTITPKHGKYLKFKIGDQWKTVKQVIIPARPVLTPAVHNNIDKMKDIILQEIMRGLNE